MTAKLKRQLQKLNAFSNHSSLTAVVMALNGNNPLLRDSEDCAALVRYVEAWNAAKRNPWKMRLTRDDAKRFSLSNLEKVWTWKLAPIGRTPATERLVEEAWKVRGQRFREDVGGAYWTSSPTGENFRDTAAMFAGILLINPLRAKLSDGPCQRDKCKQWFIKRRPLQKCCSQRCGAIVKTAKRICGQRKDEKKEKLKIVRAAHRQWRKSRSRMDWKTWVSKKTGLSTKFLTRNFTKEGRVKRRD